MISVTVGNTTQSPYVVPHAATLDKPENGIELQEHMADMIDTDPEDGYNHNDDQNMIDDNRMSATSQYLPPPGIEAAHRAYKDVQLLLKPKWKTGPGYVDPEFDSITQERLEQIRLFLWSYVDPDTTAHGGTVGSSWMAASKQTAHTLGKGNYLAQNLQK